MAKIKYTVKITVGYLYDMAFEMDDIKDVEYFTDTLITKVVEPERLQIKIIPELIKEVEEESDNE
jgi:hypothetical protein